MSACSDANSSPRPSRSNQGFRRRTSSVAGVIYATTNCHRLFQYYSIFRTGKPIVVRTCVSEHHCESIFDDFCWVADFFRCILRSSVDQWRCNLCAEYLPWRYLLFFLFSQQKLQSNPNLYKLLTLSSNRQYGINNYLDDFCSRRWIQPHKRLPGDR